MNLEFPNITSGNAKAIAFHVREGEPFGGLSKEALSEWVDSVSKIASELDQSNNKVQDLQVELTSAEIALSQVIGQLELAGNQIARYRETIKWISEQSNLFFSECSQAEEIIARCKSLL